MTGRLSSNRRPLSIDVARYVDQTFASGRLFPPRWEGLQRIVIPYIEDNVESVTFKLIDPFYLRDIEDPVERAMVRRHKERKFGPGCEERWEKERPSLQAEAERLLAPFDLSLAHGPFLFDDRPIFSDFALFGVLGNLTYHNYNSLPASLTNLHVLVRKDANIPVRVGSWKLTQLCRACSLARPAAIDS